MSETRRSALFDEIDRAFENVQRPSVFDEPVTQEKFDSWYLPKDFENLWPDFYNADGEWYRYMIPFAMKATVAHWAEDIAFDIWLDLFISSFDNGGGHRPPGEDIFPWLDKFACFNRSQRHAICSFLRYMSDQKYCYSVEPEMLYYWCSSSTEDQRLD